MFGKHERISRVTKLSAIVLILSQLSFSPFKKSEPADCTVSVNAKQQLGTVSPNLMGFNIVYCYENDAAWKSGSGKVPELLNKLGTMQYRYPAGTVVTYFHWERPTGQGWSDEWSPTFNPAKNTSPSTFMDIDEYLELVKKQHTEPLVGINMGSGKKYNRVQEGVDEAIRLMRHCMEKGVKVKYYYLDNEPYTKIANYPFSPEEYADMINIYAPAMKKVDPNIKIIINTSPSIQKYIGPILERAGKNIDYVDVHMYWKHGNATFGNWKKEGPMRHQDMGVFADQRKLWEGFFAKAGHPNIKLVVLEWNIGPYGEKNPSPSEGEAALMVSEQFTQFIQSGLFMATFWPLSWTSTATRALLNAKQQYKPNKMYDMFALYKDVLGQQKVSSKSTLANLINLAVKSKDGKTMWVYLINKQQDKAELNVDLSLEGFNAKSFTSSAFSSDDKSETGLALHALKIAKINAANYSLRIPVNSFVKLTFKM